MISINEKECVQIRTVMDRFSENDKNKVPKEIIDKIDECAKETDYKILLRDDMGIEKQISRNALIFLTLIVTKYIANNDEKDQLKRVLINNKKLIEKVENDYSYLFKSNNNKKQSDSQLALVEYKEQKSILELLNKIKRFILENFFRQQT